MNHELSFAFFLCAFLVFTCFLIFLNLIHFILLLKHNKISLIMKKKNPVVHFEMPAGDRKRMADFYSEAFGWEPQFLGEEMGNYVTVTTADSDQEGRPVQPGSINGGFYMRSGDQPANCPSLVIAVDDINEHVKIVGKAGGQVLGNPVEIPGVGQYVSFRDTEGNICSILQPVMPQSEKEEVQESGLAGGI
jgi:uncharacterized protein